MAYVDDTELRRLIADLRGFERRREVVRALRRDLRAPVPEARARIQARAVEVLPHRNGLGVWVARARVTARVNLRSANSVQVTIRDGRNSRHARSDLRAIDRGRVRAPTFGRRGPGMWHTQQVRPGFATDTVADMAPVWRAAVVTAVNRATADLRRG